MTLREFSEVFSVLAVQLRATEADEATIRGYYTALADIEPEFIALAAEKLARSAEWFPKTSEWRLMARKVERDRDDELRARLRKLPTPLCLTCDDTGWCPSSSDPTRFVGCDCRHLRRLELLGRRPFPELPESCPAPDPTQLEKVIALVRPMVRSMGKP